MNKKYNLVRILTIYFILFGSAFATSTGYFDKGKEFFEKDNFKKSKILFEKDIVFNPKSERSYLYLAKIFNKGEKDDQEEVNLDNVLLLNPKNEEAIYMLTLLKMKQSNYNEAKELIEKFNLFCKSFCFKKNELQEKFDKLIPKNEKSND